MLKPSIKRPSRLAMVRKEASMCGMSSFTTTVSIGTLPSFESHHMLVASPLGKTMSIGGILPSRIA